MNKNTIKVYHIEDGYHKNTLSSIKRSRRRIPGYLPSFLAVRVKSFSLHNKYIAILRRLHRINHE